MTFKPLFGPITKLSSSFVTFRVSHFPVSHLTHETVKLDLQNTLNMSKTTRVYFGVLHRYSGRSSLHRDVPEVIRILYLGSLRLKLPSLLQSATYSRQSLLHFFVAFSALVLPSIVSFLFYSNIAICNKTL